MARVDFVEFEELTEGQAIGIHGGALPMSLILAAAEAFYMALLLGSLK